MNKRAANLDGRTGGLVTACRPTIIGAMTDCVYMTDLQRCFAQGAKMKIETQPKVDHTPAELDVASVALLKAADLIERSGWCQHDYRDKAGRLCILGALKTAMGIPLRDSDDPIVEEASERVYKSVGMLAHGWNDRPERTQEEVVAKLRAVALGL